MTPIFERGRFESDVVASKISEASRCFRSARYLAGHRDQRIAPSPGLPTWQCRVAPSQEGSGMDAASQAKDGRVMGVRINTNIEALNAQRNLSAIASVFAKSVEKLSSGLRINRAADDSAGLAISEKLKAQVTGLNQAQRNAQDGVSMAQTAEGALTEVHSMLQRIRELAVEASNSTLSSSDAASVSIEITSLR